MKLIIPKGNITKVHHSEKSGQDYLTIEEGDSTINISSGDLDLSSVPTLEPVTIEADVQGFVFGGKNQVLRARSFTARNIAVKA